MCVCRPDECRNDAVSVRKLNVLRKEKIMEQTDNSGGWKIKNWKYLKTFYFFFLFALFK